MATRLLGSVQEYCRAVATGPHFIGRPGEGTFLSVRRRIHASQFTVPHATDIVAFMSAIFYAVIAAIAAGFYSYFQRSASPSVNQLFGALLVSATALSVAALLLVFQLGKIQLFANPVGIWFLLGAGAAAFSVDYFTLQAYSKGLPISVGAPIGIAGGIATAVVIGLFLGEQISVAKMAGIVLVVLGGIVLVVYR